MLALEFAVRFLLGLGLLERHHLRLGEQHPFLGGLGFQCLQPLLHGFQIVPLPNTAHPRRRNRHRFLFQFVRHPHLAEGRLFHGHLHHRSLDLYRHTVLQHRLAPGNLLQRQLAAFLVELLEAIEAVAAVAHYPAGLAHIPQLLGQLQHAGLRSNHFLCLRHLPSPSVRGLRRSVRRPEPSVRLSRSYYTIAPSAVFNLPRR